MSSGSRKGKGPKKEPDTAGKVKPAKRDQPSKVKASSREKKDPDIDAVATTRRPARKQSPASKPATSKPSVTKVPPVLQTTAEAQRTILAGLFSMLAARSHEHGKPPVCYNEFDDGSAQVCFLQEDGSYGHCQTYTPRPVPRPLCG